MTVQPGKLDAVDTAIDMEDFYNDSDVANISDVDRIIHDATQFARLVLQRPQPTLANRGTISGTLRTDSPQYIDGTNTEDPSSLTNLMTIGFETSGVSQLLVATSGVRIFSTGAPDNTLGKWAVSTSLTNNEDDEYENNASFIANITAIEQLVVSTAQGNRVRTTLFVDPPPISNGLPFWRVTHDDIDAFDTVTEVEIVEPLVPMVTFFDSSGNNLSNITFDDETNILDACFDTPNNVFYTIRFNTQNVGTTTTSLDDDFGEGDAGTASGTTNFNPARWTESSTNDRFLRTGDQLVYNTTAGKGQLETNYSIIDELNVNLDVLPQTVDDPQKWLTLRALNSDNHTIMSEGVGFTDSPVASGVFFSSYVTNFNDSSGSSSIRELRPIWHNASDGTDSFTVSFDGSVWTVSGSQTGVLTNATTGVTYNESIDANTPIEFIISSTTSPSAGELFTFDLETANVTKEPTATGIIGFNRGVSTFTTNNVILSPATVSGEAATLEIFGNTNGTVNIAADNYSVTTGSGSFPNVATFTVEERDTGGVLQTTVIESFDVIGDASKTYNDFLEGKAQITCTNSGSGGGSIYIKVDDQLFKYPNNIALGTEDGSNATISTTGQIAQDGATSLNWTHESGVVGGPPFLTYVEFEGGEVLLKTLDKDTLTNTSTTKKIRLNISDFQTNEYRVFYNQNDPQGFDTLYYVDASNNLQSWNLDDRISAFMAVNAEDTTLPAGTAQQTTVNAEVINAWGEALDGKTVTFQVTTGDGAVTPSSDPTVSGGLAQTQYIVGSSVGVSVVTATTTE